MIIFKRFNFWSIIWNLSEILHIGLGKFAPYVFGKMINRKPNKIIGVEE